MDLLFKISLAIHIAGGFTALLMGIVAMVTHKGGKNHRLAGKCYFLGMTIVFISSFFMSVAHHKPFLFMVGFFSYFLVVRGYRALYLKKLGFGEKARRLDWGIVIIAITVGLAMISFGTRQWAFQGNTFGVVSIVFGSICCGFSLFDIRNFVKGPDDEMHWWFTHINGMGAGYVATSTAFVVVNVHLSPAWVLWLLPTAIGLPVIIFTVRKYKKKFSKK
jgi:uncharacterized membrane protein